jgi:serine/threonine protein kinase
MATVYLAEVKVLRPELAVTLGPERAYLAPEQAAAEHNIDHRVDLYAVGVLGYELLTSRPPFTGRSSQEVLAAHMTQPPEPLWGPEAAFEHMAALPQPLGSSRIRQERPRLKSEVVSVSPTEALSPHLAPEDRCRNPLTHAGPS